MCVVSKHQRVTALTWLIPAASQEAICLWIHTALLLHAGAYFPAGGIDQKKASWYMLLFVQEGTAERLLQAQDWQLLKAITSPGVTDDALQAYVTDLSRPGRLTAG